MGTFKADLLAEFDRDVKRGHQLVTDAYAARVRAHPAMPRDEGTLAKGVKLDDPSHRPGLASTELRSTARSADGADYGTILDTSTGKLVEASSYGHKAFGPFAKPVPTSSGPTRFLPRFRVTTKHVGWWVKVNDPGLWRRASQELDRVNL